MTESDAWLTYLALWLTMIWRLYRLHCRELLAFYQEFDREFYQLQASLEESASQCRQAADLLNRSSALGSTIPILDGVCPPHPIRKP